MWGLGREPGDGICELSEFLVRRFARPRYRRVLDGLGAEGRAADAETEQCAPHSVSLRITASRPATGTTVNVTRAVIGVPRTPPVTTPTS